MKTSEHYAKILRVVLREDVVLSRCWPESVRNYLASMKKGGGSASVERRQAKRQPVELRAIIRLQKRGNEVVYLPAIMKNISATGVMLEVKDKGHLMPGTLENIEQFIVSFSLPGETEPVTVECLPRRLEINEMVGVGVEFASLSAKPHKYVM